MPNLATRLAPAALAGLLIAGCATTGGPTAPAAPSQSFPPPIPPTQTVTIRFENYLLATAGPNRDTQIQLLEEFAQKFPNIKVETKATPDQEIIPSVRAQLAAGNPPDISMLLLREWDVVVENLAPVTLESIVPPDELQAHLGGEFPIHPKAAALTRRENKLSGLPYVFSTPTLFYNADIFRAAGLDPNRPPKTWDELKQMGLQIKERTGKQSLYVACIELDWCSQALVFSNGGKVVSDDRTKIQFGEQPAIDAFKTWQDLVTSGVHVKLTGAEAMDSFAAGNMAMYLQTSASQARLIASAKDKWELKSAGMPGFAGKPVRPTNSGAGLGILATDPLKQRAAWELMKFLTSDRAYTLITPGMGYLPLRPGLVKDDRHLKAWANNSLVLPNLEQLDGLEASVTYPGDNQVQIRDIYLKTQQNVLLNGADAERSWREAQSRAQELMPRR